MGRGSSWPKVNGVGTVSPVGRKLIGDTGNSRVGCPSRTGASTRISMGLVRSNGRPPVRRCYFAKRSGSDDDKIGRLWKFEVTAVDEWVRAGGVDAHDQDDKGGAR